MGHERRQIIVKCTITAHASPRWKGASTEEQRVANNDQLALRRAQVVKDAVERQLRNRLGGDYSLQFLFDQSVSDEDELPNNSVLVGAVGRGQRDSIVAAKGDRQNDDELYRRVDVDVRIARKLDEDIPSEVVHRYKQGTKTRFWYVGASAGIGLHVGAGINVIFLELRNLYQKATGVAYAAGAGVGLSGVGKLISSMSKGELLRASASASFGEEASFSTDKEVGFRDFHGRRIRFTSANAQIVFGYEWSYLSFSDMGDGSQSIPVGGVSLGADAALSASTGVGLLYLFDIPDDWVGQEFTRTEWDTRTSRWITTAALPIHFGTGSSDLGSSAAVQLAKFLEQVAADFRKQ